MACFRTAVIRRHRFREGFDLQCESQSLKVATESKKKIKSLVDLTTIMVPLMTRRAIEMNERLIIPIKSDPCPFKDGQ